MGISRSILRFRVLGNRADVDEAISALGNLDSIEHVEEMEELSPTMRDDSSPAKLTDDNTGNTYVIEVDAPDDEAADQARVAAQACAASHNAGIEFIEAF